MTAHAFLRGLLIMGMLASVLLAVFLLLVLTADRSLRRRIKRNTIGALSGWKITGDRTWVGHMDDAHKIELVSLPRWWKCILPWPGKTKWAETIFAKVALLGATIEYNAVSAFDWDEAYTVVVDDDKIIASSSRLATAIAYLKHMGVET